MDEREYCPECKVSMDLHAAPAPEGCFNAEQKADLIAQVFRIGPNEMFG